MIQSLLIANRGEIACRIIRTARAMGIRTVAVHSDADAKALHVRRADEAVHIGPSPARESYLRGDTIIAAARETGAEAIHPGYGFLSENADFAQAVIDAGLVWVGPRPDSIRAMGLKDAAKARMIAAGVPVTPGYLGEDQSPERLRAEADAIGYPVLIKAVAGGGGKGMRRVEAAADFAEALASCRREAAASFGDERVLIEKYIRSPRHIEVQVFGDTHGHIVHLFERDCSLQRRHQKVIEEAPAPGMSDETRAQLCAAAVRAAKAVDYVGAGTIEFIADASEGLRADRIWFMEMNTRLQVEHPVTEEITGVDLVEWQLRVASGEPLPRRQDELAINGHAIEARLYAEDPARGSLPSVGRLELLPFAFSNERGSSSALRIDTGVEEGAMVTPFYDPMIAKVIVHRSNRSEAIEALAAEMAAGTVYPVRTNASFVVRALRTAEFCDGAIDTGLIERLGDRLTEPAPLDERTVASAAAMLSRPWDERDVLTSPGNVWQVAEGLRLNSPPARQLRIAVDGDARDVEPLHLPYGEIGAGLYAGFVRWLSDSAIIVTSEGTPHRIELYRPRGGSVGHATSGAILSPMPGRIIAVEVAAGDRVVKGQRLLTLEAMKMEHSLTAPFDGIVAELHTAPGAQVQVEALLARVEAGGDAA
jgi:3-methylcrotonyl-CoA carboxylase alpha subunit